MRNLNLFLILLLVATGGALGFQNRSLKSDLGRMEIEKLWPTVGRTIPLTEKVAVDGRKVALGSAPKGKSQVLFFFMSQCPACKQSMPYVHEIAASCKRNGVEFVAVTPENEGFPLRSFMASNKIDYPVVAGLSRRELQVFDFRMSPTIVVVNSNGVIKHVKVGAILSNMDAYDLVRGALDMDVKPPQEVKT